MNSLISEYKSFLNRIKDVKKYIENISSKGNIYDDFLKIELPKELVERINYLKELPNSIIQYNASIISLYGAFENYIDNLLNTYLDLIFNNEKKLKEFPSKITVKYKTKFGEYLMNPGRFPSDYLEEQELNSYSEFIKKNYTSCNKQLILSHSSNLHISTIQELLNALGINNFSLIYDVDEVKKYFLNYMDESEYRRRKSRQNSLLDDYERFVTSRNYVAHGKNVDERISINDLLNKVIPLLENIGLGILNLCIDSYVNNLQEEYKIEKDFIAIHNKHICCVNCLNIHYEIGDIFLYKTDERIGFSKVESIEVNHESRTKTPNGNVDVGIKVANRVPINSKLVYLKI